MKTEKTKLAVEKVKRIRDLSVMRGTRQKAEICALAFEVIALLEGTK